MKWSHEKISNKSFLERFDIEYRSVANWTTKSMDLSNSTTLDFGCGQGIAALRFALENPNANVNGIDINSGADALRNLALEQLGLKNLPSNLSLFQSDTRPLPFAENMFDMIYSWSTFEHINEKYLSQVISELSRILKPNGILFLQIDPLYYSSGGAHLYSLLEEPWVHLRHQHDFLKEMLFSKSTNFLDLNREQSEKELDRQKTRLWEQYRTLNKITADELVAVACDSGFSIMREHRDELSTEPPKELLKIYNKEVLTNNQIKLMLKSEK